MIVKWPCDVIFYVWGKLICKKNFFSFVFAVLPSDFVPDRNISFFLPAAWPRMAGEVKLSEA